MESTVKQLRSYISSGHFKDARKLIFIRRLKGNNIAEDIELLKESMAPDDGVCGCGNHIKPVWDDFCLKYKTAESCDPCLVKMQEDKEEVEREREEMLRQVFEDKKDGEVEKFLLLSGVPSLYIKSSIEHIDESVRSKLNGMSYYLHGDIGSGKTYLSAAILREHIESFSVVRGRNGYCFDPKGMPIFVSVPELLLEIRQCFSQESSIEEASVVAKYSNTPFLILDDLGVEKTTDWSLQTLYLIINRRSVEPQRITVVTSNLTLNQIAQKLEDRIASRLAGMCHVLELRGKDRRLDINES